ncbi:MAG: GlcG/HbpS family heme-binding protein [Actinomycetota bacterium]
MRTIITHALAAAAIVAAVPALAGDEATFQLRLLTPETALAAAKAALDQCRADGYQVAVAVVDRGGNVQVAVRDRFAGAHTVDTAVGKAWTAVSFRTSTADLDAMTQPGKASFGIRNLPKVIIVAGGMKIESAGQIVAGIGVSGAPGGNLDEKCAVAGIKAIQDSLDF